VVNIKAKIIVLFFPTQIKFTLAVGCIIQYASSYAALRVEDPWPTSVSQNNETNTSIQNNNKYKLYWGFLLICWTKYTYN